MDDLISRAAAIEAALDGADDWDGGYNPERERHIREHMANIPAANAIRVVRCRDCKWFDCKNYVCNNDILARRIVDCGCYPNFNIELDWFCADGERREEAKRDD